MQAAHLLVRNRMGFRKSLGVIVAVAAVSALWPLGGRTADAAPGPGVDPASVDSAAAAPSPATHFTSLALSSSTLAWGTSSNAPTRQQADAIALEACAKWAKDCEIVEGGQGRCIALATSPDLAWGAGGGRTITNAQDGALSVCKREANGTCTVQTHLCPDD